MDSKNDNKKTNIIDEIGDEDLEELEEIDEGDKTHEEVVQAGSDVNDKKDEVVGEAGRSRNSGGDNDNHDDGSHANKVDDDKSNITASIDGPGVNEAPELDQGQIKDLSEVHEHEKSVDEDIADPPGPEVRETNDIMTAPYVANVQEAPDNEDDGHGDKLKASGEEDLEDDQDLVEDINEIVNFINAPVPPPSPNMKSSNNNQGDRPIQKKSLGKKNRKRKKSLISETPKRPKLSQVEASKFSKPVQNWRKAIKLPMILEDRSLSNQLFPNVMPTYIPHVPKGTSERLIQYLTQREVELLCCPGCKDRFVLPNSYFQHIYRKSVNINFDCQACQKNLVFQNRCHLKIHVQSHLEIDGTSTVSSNFINISPLDKSGLDVGSHGDGFQTELDLTHELLVHTTGKDRSFQQCKECRLSFEGPNLSQHFQEAVAEGKVFECDECSAVLLNACSFSAHKRIHSKLKPYICPECGSHFETFPCFRRHVRDFCHHDTKVVTMDCKICLKKNAGNPILESRQLLSHIYDTHIKLYYKCTSCPKAYDSKSAIYEHREKVHKDKTDGPDFSLLYKAPFMKQDNLFSSREAFEVKMMGIAKHWPLLVMFKCHSCRLYLPDANMLEQHQQRCNNSRFGSLFPCEQSEKRIQEKKNKLDSILAEMSNLLNSECIQCEDVLVRLKNDILAHLSGKRNPHPAVKCNEFSTEKALPETIVQAKRPVRLLRSASDSRPVQKVPFAPKVLSTLKVPSTPEPVSPQEPPMKSPSGITDSAEAKAEPKPDKPIGKRSGKGSKMKGKTSDIKPFVESLGIDIPSSKTRLAFNRLDKSALSLGSSVVKNQVKLKKNARNFKCALCDFSTELRASFQTHIRIHRPLSAGEDFHQCKECGMSFASEPAFKKHLFLLHRIKEPDPSHYCSDLITTKVQTNKDIFAFSEESDSGGSEPPLTIDEDEERVFKARQNVCSVCSRAFSTPLELRRHFRGHGMAFLMTSKK